MAQSKPFYRAEIDGLRAIAVISVILYHAQVVWFDRAWFGGGYIGVDIFFVISGYLITRIILCELYEKGSFSFAHFYERRARRILPALFLVIFVSIPFAWQKLLPSAFVEYTQSILATVGFSANFFFYFSTTEYGDESALLKPFLHMWSLGVEEQFYLVLPVLMIFVFKFFRRHFLIIFAALCLLSFQCAGMMETRNFTFGFYFPFCRFWELALGSLLAYAELNYGTARRLRGWQQALPMLGLSVVIYSVLFFDGTMPYPDISTAIVLLGVVLIIGYTSADDWAGKILSSKPLVGVGLISYSAYLWHFPVFAFARINGEPSVHAKFDMLVAITVLSSVSYVFVERPFRNQSQVSTRRFWFATVVCLMALGAFCASSLMTGGFSHRVPVGWKNFELDNEKLEQSLWSVFDAHQQSLRTPRKDKINVYVFGNSHAANFLNALLLQPSNYQEFHFLKLERMEQLSCFDESDPRFASIRESFYNSAAYKEAKIVILASYFINAKCDKSKTDNPTDSEGLSSFIPRLQKDGKRILLLGNTAVIPKKNGKIVADRIFAAAQKAKIDFSSPSVFQSYKDRAALLAFSELSEGNLATIDRLRAFAKANGLAYFERLPLFCRFQSKRCVVYTEDGFKIRCDHGHLTQQGDKYYSDQLVRVGFADVLRRVYQEPARKPSKLIAY